MNFTINQTKSSQEIVNSALLSKLYNLFITNGNSHTINLLGNLYSSTGYKVLIDSLTQTYPDLIITVPLEGLYILFEDPNVEAILQVNNIGDGVGITVLSASDAILTSSTFKNNTDITLFPEFKYFTKANTNPPANLFLNCTNLTSIDLSNVTALSASEFKNSGLSGEISLSNLTSLGANAFLNCTGVTSVDLTGSTITSIPGSCFYNCKSLTSVTLPSTCVELAGLCFRGCSSLTTIDVSNIKNFGYQCMLDISNINHLDLSSATYLDGECFNNCGNISITIPSTQLNIREQYASFRGNCYLLNLYGSVENWTSIHRDFPKFAISSSGIDILNFKNATTILPKSGSSGTCGAESGLCAQRNYNTSIKCVYVPKIQEISCYSTSGNRIISAFSNGVQQYVNDGNTLRMDLLYFKNLAEIISSPFGGLVCQAFVINNTTPPTITPQVYNTIVEYTSNVSNVKVNAWADVEDATDPTASITNTGNYSNYYNTNKKLRHIPTITAIYVPDSAVNTYKTTTGWTSVAGLIQPISSLNSGVVYATLQDWETAGKPVGLIAECLDLSTADLATFMSNNNLTYWTNPNA